MSTDMCLFNGKSSILHSVISATIFSIVCDIDNVIKAQHVYHVNYCFQFVLYKPFIDAHNQMHIMSDHLKYFIKLVLLPTSRGALYKNKVMKIYSTNGTLVTPTRTNVVIVTKQTSCQYNSQAVSRMLVLPTSHQFVT